MGCQIWKKRSQREPIQRRISIINTPIIAKITRWILITKTESLVILSENGETVCAIPAKVKGFLRLS
jgi:hypothetical protein